MPLADRLGRFSRAFAPRPPVVRHALRTAVAALAAESLAVAAGLPQSYWAVISAVAVVQLTIGATLWAAVTRTLGTLAGASAGLLGLWLAEKHGLPASLALVGAVGLGAYAEAAQPSLRVAAITAAIILLGPVAGNGAGAGGGEEPIAAALARAGDVLLGCLVGLASAALILPSHAGHDVNRRLVRLLGLSADLLALHTGRLQGRDGDPEALASLNHQLRTGLIAADSAATDARHELEGHLSAQPDPKALVRAVRRLRYAIIMVGRAADSALPPALLTPVGPALTRVAESSILGLHQLAHQLEQHQPARLPEELAQAQQALAEAIEAFRATGQLRALEVGAVARLYTSWFALEQVGLNLAELAERITDHAKA